MADRRGFYQPAEGKDFGNEDVHAEIVKRASRTAMMMQRGQFLSIFQKQ